MDDTAIDIAKTEPLPPEETQGEEKPIECTSTPTVPIEQSGQNHLVIIVHASVGSGHRSAALAVEQAYEILKAEHDLDIPEDLETEVIDILDYGRIHFDGDKTASGFVGATRPLYDIIWRYFFTGRYLWGGGSIWSRIMFKPFTDLIEQRRPMAIVATHITGANSAVAARMITGQDFPIICVPTDYETEGLWPHRCTDMFCVATDPMVETLRARLIEPERIRITGIPTREAFRRGYDKQAVREKFGLPQDKYVVLALAGAHLPRPYQHFREALDKILPYMHTFENLHFAIICGRDEDYKRHVEAQCNDLRIENATVFDYVEDMAALMAASDLVVCKAGGLTVTECLCAEVPMLLLGRAYGQEKINTEMLTANGAAMHVTTWRELLNTLRAIVKNPERINAMLVNGKSVRKPDAARDVARAAIELSAVKRSPDHFLRQKHFVRFYRGEKPAHVR